MQANRNRLLIGVLSAALLSSLTGVVQPSPSQAAQAPPSPHAATGTLLDTEHHRLATDDSYAAHATANEPTAEARDAARGTAAAAAGRATGSGSFGYVGEYGTANNKTEPAAGEFNHPYDIAVDPRDGTSLVVSDSGNVNWGVESSFSQVSGHSLQWLKRSATFDPERGQYRGGGEYDLSSGPGIGFGGNFEFTQLKRQQTASGVNLGPRGVAISQAGEVFVTASQLGTLSGLPGNSVRRIAADGTELSNFGSWQNGLLSWPVAVDLDAQGLVYVSSQDGYTVSDNFGSVVVYTEAGDLVSSYPGPEIPLMLGVVVGNSSADRVELWALSSPGTSARVVKLIAHKGGGDAVPGRNPAGWIWEVDTSFESVPLTGKHFTLSADLDRGELYAMPRTGLVRRIDAHTGENLGTLGTRGSGASPGQYAMSRGAVADTDGYLHVTTESGILGASTHTRVQIFAETPDPVAGLEVEASHDSVSLSWSPLALGGDTPYGQAHLRDYVVEYRGAAAGGWQTLDRDTPSTEARAVVHGLTPETEYEFRVTAFNEAGSGDHAAGTATTAKTPGPGVLSVEKLGNGQTATEHAPVSVDAGTEVTFEYRVTNTGESAVTNLSLSDDRIGTIDLQSAVNPGDTVTATATDVLGEGGYVNVAQVSGETLGNSVDATATWFGVGEPVVIDPPVDPPVDPPTTPPGEGGSGSPQGGWLTGTGGPLPVALITMGVLLVSAGAAVVVVRLRRNYA